MFDVAHRRGPLTWIDLEQALRDALEGDGWEVHGHYLAPQAPGWRRRPRFPDEGPDRPP